MFVKIWPNTQCYYEIIFHIDFFTGVTPVFLKSFIFCVLLWVPRKALYKCNKLLLYIIYLYNENNFFYNIFLHYGSKNWECLIFIYFVYLSNEIKIVLLCFVAVFIRNEESDFATWAYFEEGRQWGGGVRFLSPAALETGWGGAQPATLHLGRQYVQCTSALFYILSHSCILYDDYHTHLPWKLQGTSVVLKKALL